MLQNPLAHMLVNRALIFVGRSHQGKCYNEELEWLKLRHRELWMRHMRHLSTGLGVCRA